MASLDSNHPNKNKAREKVGKLLPGYTKADERNLPKIDLFMICHYFRDLRHPAMKHIKMQRSAGEDYGNDAVGYVQLRRTGGRVK
ncbi:hypothetical protein Pmani_030233 [Petrolisthes manimaculis]|uniref:Uncharacterized protein n=1 Tax=Petrolisthes manimaculis TaxID=1843537 RepID=A0AAE1NXW9_9EUCA|nr:hypothetical protein Pmani_030233 [Petrolisthes manimaculis]